MSILKTAMRNALPAAEFGEPAQRKYPLPDANHARNALARASQQEKAGNLTPAQKAAIDAKANQVLGRK